MDQMKECIACAEEILQKAQLCKHCGTDQRDERFGVPEIPRESDLLDDAVALFQNGQFQEGLQLIAHLVADGDANATSMAGWAHHEMGDKETALRLSILAAEVGHEHAMMNIVHILDVEGCSPAERQTYRGWLEKLAAKGHTFAMMYLYQDYLDHEEPARAHDWLNLAAKAGDQDAIQELTTWKIKPVTVRLPREK